MLRHPAVEADCVSSVVGVFDQYLSFISLDPTLFVLRENQRESVQYRAFTDPTVADSACEASLQDVVDGLFSVFVTVGQLPLIQHSGSVSGMLAPRLVRKFADYARRMFPDSSSMLSERPVRLHLRACVCVCARARVRVCDLVVVFVGAVLSP